MVCDSYHHNKGILRSGNETCQSAGERCFVLWRDETNKRNETLHIVIKKGCFGVSPANSLDHCQDDCIQNHKLAFRTENVSGICCCNIDMCNVNFTSVPYVKNETTTAPTTTYGMFSLRGRSNLTSATYSCVCKAVLRSLVWEPNRRDKSPEVCFKFLFNLIGKLTVAFLTGQS